MTETAIVHFTPESSHVDVAFVYPARGVGI